MSRSQPRIAGGHLSGRRLRTPASGTRPATAIIRSAIFDRPDIGGVVAGARVLDLYAGAGYLGIEALSRGAASVDFVERNGPACAVIRRNLDELGLTERARVHRLPVERCFSRIPLDPDLIFIDPPYRVDARAVIEALVDRVSLPEGSIAVWRRQTSGSGGVTPPPARIGDLVRIDQRRYGDGAIDTYRAEAPT
ncbi:MAG: methyltransferase [Chloroflexi bacterium]|nr:methyltransferase [Chloroflexota bacterium]MXX81015.1 methyltransferase [Chloroflexota bacterium]MYD17101.1 methyltransferase [Chloroflexota bacterium]MYF21699.1 methyltransferase [Chloroflexota bacterium]